MVVQSGEDSAGGKGTKPVKTKSILKYIAIAAVCAVAIIGVLAVSGIFNSDPAPIADTTASTSSGWQPPANSNPVGRIPPNEPDESSSKAIPNPKTIPYTINKNLDDASTSTGILIDKKYLLYVVDFKIEASKGKLTGAIENRDNQKVIVAPFKVSFQNKLGHALPFRWDPNDVDIDFKWHGKITYAYPRSSEKSPEKNVIIIHPNEKIKFTTEFTEECQYKIPEIKRIYEECEKTKPQYVLFYGQIAGFKTL